MFGKILGRKKDEISDEERELSEIVEKISTMNLTDMRAYIKSNITGFEPCEDGLVAVMSRLLTKNEETSKRYIELDDQDSKKKKGFEIVLSIAGHKRVTITAVEQIQEFIALYSDIILKYDTDNKQIYSSRLKDSIDKAIETVGMMAEVNRKAKVLGD